MQSLLPHSGGHVGAGGGHVRNGGGGEDRSQDDLLLRAGGLQDVQRALVATQTSHTPFQEAKSRLLSGGEAFWESSRDPAATIEAVIIQAKQ